VANRGEQNHRTGEDQQQLDFAEERTEFQTNGYGERDAQNRRHIERQPL
jgi:hypothetical protein